MEDEGLLRYMERRAGKGHSRHMSLSKLQRHAGLVFRVVSAQLQYGIWWPWQEPKKRGGPLSDP